MPLTRVEISISIAFFLPYKWKPLPREYFPWNAQQVGPFGSAAPWKRKRNFFIVRSDTIWFALWSSVCRTAADVGLQSHCSDIRHASEKCHLRTELDFALWENSYDFFLWIPPRSKALSAFVFVKDAGALVVAALSCIVFARDIGRTFAVGRNKKRIFSKQFQSQDA